MASEDRKPRAWHDVHSVQEAPREKQKSSGRIAAEEAAARKKIEALRAQRLAREAEAAANPPPPKPASPSKKKAAT
ncbi:transcriptional regulator [Bosea caraganae]|uniref:Transcriptional regulator n=1 Tax=Bosea caraganae TaxID=2763117 RepID=A0A370L724_9HYPH|nr:transcriptional regulator [Bosea caraganae]RDJ23284.1 transcriptional regulator [Bosea caraganae]RDJ24603.1 transcriptional regulator [Bosea caraganae]